jgi:hypothetical protein
MSRVKSRLLCALGVLAVFAISGVAASTASAAFVLKETACGSGSIVNLCWETAEKGTSLKQLSGEEEFLILLASGGVTLKATLGGSVVEIKCNDTIGFRTTKEVEEGLPEDFALLILQPEPLIANSTIDATLLFIECKLEKELGTLCVVPTEKETAALVGTVEENENNILFKPVSGTIFIEIPFSNNGSNTCPSTIKGTKKVTGEQLCTWDTVLWPVLEDLEQHLLICKENVTTPPELQFAEQAAAFEADYEIALVNEPIWDIEES